MLKNKLLENYLNKIYEKSNVKIILKKGDLGLSLDDPISDYKKKIENGKKWEEMSQQINALVILNKNKNPDISNKAKKIRNSLSTWVKKKRETNPDFAK